MLAIVITATVIIQSMNYQENCMYMAISAILEANNLKGYLRKSNVHLFSKIRILSNNMITIIHLN